MSESDDLNRQNPQMASPPGGATHLQENTPSQPPGQQTNFNYPQAPYPYPYPLLPMRRAGQGTFNLVARLIALSLFITAGLVLWFGNYGTYSEIRGGGMSGYSISDRSSDRVPFVVMAALGAILVAFSFLSRWVAIAAAVIALLGILMFVTYGSAPAYWAQHLSIYLYLFAVISALVSLRK